MSKYYFYKIQVGDKAWNNGIVEVRRFAKPGDVYAAIIKEFKSDENVNVTIIELRRIK